MLLSDQWRFCTKADCRDSEPILDLHDRSFARSWLNRFKRDERRLTAMRRILIDGGFRQVSRFSSDEVICRISEMLYFNRLHIHAQPLPVATAGGGVNKAESEKFVPFPLSERKQRNQDKGSAPDLTWIEVHLVDLDNNPLAGERYQIRLPNSSLREGTLDSAGKVRFDGITPGQATISFPDIDGREWAAK